MTPREAWQAYLAACYAALTPRVRKSDDYPRIYLGDDVPATVRSPR